MEQSPDLEPDFEESERDAPAAGCLRRSFVGSLLVSAALVVLALLLLGRVGLCDWRYLCGPFLAEDINQGRMDTALPAPRGGLRVEQSFTPRRDGLAEIEIVLVRYGGEATPGEQSTLTVELRDEFGALVAAKELATAGLTHNQVYTLQFEPQRNSAGRRYTVALRGSEQNNVSAWGYSLDVYDAGELLLLGGWTAEQAAQPAAAELRFVTRYALTPGDTLAAAALPLREWLLALAALLLLPLPGVLLLLAARPRGWDGAAWWGAALALGVAAWPLVWQWLSLAGMGWSGAALWVVVLAGWAVAVVVTRRRRAAGGGRGGRPAVLTNGLLAALLLLTVASRFVAVRDQAFPPWVDSSRHALITAVMTDTGRIPTDYGNYLPVDHFPYHFGFHTLSAGLSLMTGRPLPVLLLVLMQLLGGLLPLPVYAAGWLLTRRRAVGLLAAFLVALPFFFPGYYATWGRMTQLAAMVVMPVLLALTWRLGKGWPRLWPLVGVLAAGLFLLHFRVFVFYLPFAVLVALAHLLLHRRALALLKAAALAVVLVLPRAAALLAATAPLDTLQQSLPGYNDFPMGYVTTGWERAWLVLAAVAGLVVLGGVVRQRRWAWFPLLLLLWVGALFLLLAGQRLGLPESLVVNLNSMYITLFLPLALLLAVVAGRLWGGAGQTAARAPAAVAAGLAALGGATAGVVLGVLLLFGWRQQANILNMQTILARPEDTAALAWLDDNLPDDARVAVSAWQWLGTTWAGSDGGAWVVPLTGREATTPPVDHIYNEALYADVRAFNDAAQAVADWSMAESAARLDEQGITHVFVGQRGGFFDPAQLSRNPALEQVYSQDGTFIFAIR